MNWLLVATFVVGVVLLGSFVGRVLRERRHELESREAVRRRLNAVMDFSRYHDRPFDRPLSQRRDW